MLLLQIWQEDGLDLCLIPYGCVATGPNSGVIEVVKNARTVADVRYIIHTHVYTHIHRKLALTRIHTHIYAHTNIHIIMKLLF